MCAGVGGGVWGVVVCGLVGVCVSILFLDIRTTSINNHLTVCSIHLSP